MQMAPFAHGFWLVVTLLPAMQSVLSRRFYLLITCLLAIGGDPEPTAGARTRPELPECDRRIGPV